MSQALIDIRKMRSKCSIHFGVLTLIAWGFVIAAELFWPREPKSHWLFLVAYFQAVAVSVDIIASRIERKQIDRDEEEQKQKDIADQVERMNREA